MEAAEIEEEEPDRNYREKAHMLGKPLALDPSKLRPYSPKETTCPGCGHSGEADQKYAMYEKNGDDKVFMPVPHIQRRCENCHMEWKECPYYEDKEEPKSPRQFSLMVAAIHILVGFGAGIAIGVMVVSL